MRTSKRDLALQIVEQLLESDMIQLNCGDEFYLQTKEEVADLIKEQLEQYVIVEGGILE